MSNRLKFFREQMAAFEGTADPQRAVESGYYVPEPRRSVSELITRRIALRPSSTHLLLGGIGSGKTTQLLVTCKRINEEIEDIHARYVDVSLYGDIFKISTGVLVAIAGLELAELLKDSDDELVKKNIDIIKKLAYGYNEIRYIYDDYDDREESGYITKHHQGILMHRDNAQEKELVKAVSQIDKDAFLKYGKIVFLFDGLDRLDNSETFSQLVAADLQDLSSAGLGIVLVGSLHTLYNERGSTIAQAVNYFDYQACFDVENDPDARIFFESILKARASEGFIEPSAMQSLIHYSGGALRDLINLTQASIEEAYLSDSDNLQKTHIEAAVASFSKAKILGISDDDLKIMAEILTKNTFTPRTNEDVRLLVTGRILEYRYPERRYVVHPAIQPLIQKIKV